MRALRISLAAVNLAGWGPQKSCVQITKLTPHNKNIINTFTGTNIAVPDALLGPEALSSALWAERQNTANDEH